MASVAELPFAKIQRLSCLSIVDNIIESEQQKWFFIFFFSSSSSSYSSFSSSFSSSSSSSSSIYNDLNISTGMYAIMCVSHIIFSIDTVLYQK